ARGRRLPREEDDGDALKRVAPTPQGADHRDAVEARHPNVRENEVRRRSRDDLVERFVAVGRASHVVLVAEKTCDGRACGLVVVDYEDPLSCRRRHGRVSMQCEDHAYDAPARAMPFRCGMARILIVDDDPVTRKALVAELSRPDRELATAEDGEDALRRALE